MPEIKSQVCFLTPNKLQPQLPLFVFLPGMDGTGHLLRSQTAGLEAAFDVRCLAIPPDDLNPWEGLIDQVTTLVEETLAERSPTSQPVYLCGESFGGCLALKLIRHAPHLFDRLVLVNPASSFNRRWLLHWGSYLGQWLPEPLHHLSAFGLLPFLADLNRLAPQDSQDLLRITQMVPQQTSQWRLSLLREFALTPQEITQIHQPTLLVASAADRLLPSVPEAQHLFRWLPDARMVVLPESGHACLLETGVNLYDLLEAQDFLHQRKDQRGDRSLVLSGEG